MRAHLALIAVVAVWAGSFSVIKALLDRGIAAEDIALLRYAIAVPGFALVLWLARGLPGLTLREAARSGLDCRRGERRLAHPHAARAEPGAPRTAAPA